MNETIKDALKEELIRKLNEKENIRKKCLERLESYNKAKNDLFEELESFVSNTPAKATWLNNGVFTNVYENQFPLKGISISFPPAQITLQPQLAPGGDALENSSFALAIFGTKLPPPFQQGLRIVYNPLSNEWRLDDPNKRSKDLDGFMAAGGEKITLEDFKRAIINVLG